MKNIRLSIATLVLLALVACSTVYTGIVTITTVVDSAMRDWAQMSVAHQTTAAVDAKVIAAHDKYRAACSAAETALVAYKASGDQNAYIAAVTAARAAAGEIIDLIAPLLAPAKAQALHTQLASAKTL